MSESAHAQLTHLQWRAIIQIAETLNAKGIPYHFDASTALFVHGIDIEMDDVDISIQWDTFQAVHKLLSKYGPTPIFYKAGWHQFHVDIDEVDVHVLSSENMTDLVSQSERVRLIRGSTVFWSKAVEFYRRHLKDDHPWAPRIDQFLKVQKS